MSSLDRGGPMGPPPPMRKNYGRPQEPGAGPPHPYEKKSRNWAPPGLNYSWWGRDSEYVDFGVISEGTKITKR